MWARMRWWNDFARAGGNLARDISKDARDDLRGQPVHWLRRVLKEDVRFGAHCVLIPTFRVRRWIPLPCAVR